MGKPEEIEPICTATFKGIVSKDLLYLILDYIDQMKQRQFEVYKHDREDLSTGDVMIDYILKRYH